MSDAVFATGWETAYPVFNDAGDARKCYFVQDFEPLFYPVGSEYVLAENTYRFNFFGITAGKWQFWSTLWLRSGLRDGWFTRPVHSKPKKTRPSWRRRSTKLAPDLQWKPPCEDCPGATPATDSSPE